MEFKSRSADWFDDDGIDGFLQRASLKVQGYRDADFRDRPIIGICNNWSELTRCHLHFNGLVEAVKRGVAKAGGFPREFNTITMGADLAHPVGISFMHRNLLSMEVEQTARAYPLDGLVMLGACDETIPGMLMAAASIDLPTIVLPGGPGLNGRWKGETVGSSTDCHRFLADLRAGKISVSEWHELESAIERSPGHCTTMGTASTMACLTEALGMALTGSAAMPAVDARRLTLAQDVGERAVAMVRAGITPSRVMTKASFGNAIACLNALGGSTNAVIHLLAIAGRLGLDLTLRDFNDFGLGVPVLANLKPSGQHLMEDFFYAGGMPALMGELRDRLDLSAHTVTGRSLEQSLEDAPAPDGSVIRPLSDPVDPAQGLMILYGNVAPAGAVLKRSAASPELLRHQGRAVVFENKLDLEARLDSDELDVSAGDVIVLRNAGPVGAPGMPEWGSIPLPRRVLATGVRDMVRISDSRMSGTAFGTNVLHATPEAAVGGPIALVRTGDPIRLDASEGVVEVCIPAPDLLRRQPRSESVTPSRGYERLYVEHVLGADRGCDFDFLTGARS